MKDLVDVYYPEAEVIRLVLDNLNIHNPAALYEVFEPQEARRIIRKLEFHYTPKHARNVKPGRNRIIRFIPSMLRAANSRSTNIEIWNSHLGEKP